MMDYYKEAKETGLRALGSVMHQQKLEDDHDAVYSAVAAILKHGTFGEAVRAIGALIDWKWGCHEIAAHSAKA